MVRGGRGRDPIAFEQVTTWHGTARTHGSTHLEGRGRRRGDGGVEPLAVGVDEDVEDEVEEEEGRHEGVVEGVLAQEVGEFGVDWFWVGVGLMFGGVLKNT